MRDSMVFYRSFYEAIKDLKPAQYKELVNAIFAYAMDDKEPALNDTSKALFVAFKPSIDTNNIKYKNGCKGGRPVSKPDIKPVKKNSFTDIENSKVDFEEMGKRVFKN